MCSDHELYAPHTKVYILPKHTSYNYPTRVCAGSFKLNFSAGSLQTQSAHQPVIPLIYTFAVGSKLTVCLSVQVWYCDNKPMF